MLKDKKILLGVCGGIAAYKAADLASKLTQTGAIVKTIMTKSACELIQPLTFKSLTHQSVSIELFNLDAPIEHVSLADWADIIIIAPATANIIAKTANGIADDLLTTVLCAAHCPVLFIPAMNVNMYANPIFQQNMLKLKNLGYLFAEPESGHLACGYEGKGRFPQTEEILYQIKTFLLYKQDLINKKILITAGATREKIDPMRFISNNSTGKMGIALARACQTRGAEVTLIHGFLETGVPTGIKTIFTPDAESMYKSVLEHSSDQDIIIMCAAVSDYSPSTQSEFKLKKQDKLTINLDQTKDILQKLGELKTANQILIGFAAETNDMESYAKSKLEKKKTDFIVANDLKVAGKNDTEVILISKGKVENLSGSKFSVAHQLIDACGLNYVK